MNMSIVHIGKNTTDCLNNSSEEQALLSANPPCEIELTDADLEAVYGGGLVGGLPVVGGLVGGQGQGQGGH